MCLNPLYPIYSMLDSSGRFQEYRSRHGLHGSNVLSVLSAEVANLIVEKIKDEIADKVVVEVGAGIGLLGIALGQYARKVFCIEANPYWGFVFAENLVADKPQNVSFLLGAAEEFRGIISGDVALFCAHLSIPYFSDLSSLFAPRVIDIYGEIFGRDSVATEDKMTRLKRELKQ